jgi:hypothetical protein
MLISRNKNALSVGGAAERVCGGAGDLATSARACPPPGPATGLHFTPVLAYVQDCGFDTDPDPAL